ncbi:hypothetical protein HN51_058117, partial [Arachis hypogaea]
MLPPRRGRVKIRIFKSIVTALSCSGHHKKQKDGGGEGSYYNFSACPLSSTSTALPRFR